MLLLWNTAGTI